jgi:cytosine permease
LLNSIIPPIGAVIIADFFFVNREKYKTFDKENFENVNINAILAWIIGVIASKFIPGIPPINGVIVSALVFVIMSKIFNPKAFIEKNKQKVGEHIAN